MYDTIIKQLTAEAARLIKAAEILQSINTNPPPAPVAESVVNVKGRHVRTPEERARIGRRMRKYWRQRRLREQAAPAPAQ